MASALIGAKFRAWANDGTPLAFGKVYTYETGTTVPKATYTTEAQTTPNANPVILNASGYADIYLDGSYKIVVKDADDVEIHTTDPVSDPSNVGASATLRNADTIQDLLAINPAVISSVLVIDYHGDVTGGGGNFVWDATAVKNTHNGGTIIDPDVTYPTDWTNQAQLAVWFDGSANVTTGCWIRKYDGDINPRMFGAKGDGVTDDSAAIQAALNASYHVVVPIGSYLITSTINVPAYTKLEFNGGTDNLQQGPKAKLIKAASMTTAAITIQGTGIVDGGGLFGNVGNTGDGVQLIGNSSELHNFHVFRMGGVGVRIGRSDTTYANCNSSKVINTRSRSNGSHGFYLHDNSTQSASAASADVNALTLIDCTAIENGGDGIKVGRSWWTIIINALTEANSGWGLNISSTVTAPDTVAEARYTNVFGGDFNEGNTLGSLNIAGYGSSVFFSQTNQALTQTGVFSSLFGGNGSNLYSLLVRNGGLTVAQGNSGAVVYPVNITSGALNSNGAGRGLLFSDTDVTTPRSAGSITSYQATTNQDSMGLNVNYNGTLQEFLKLNPNARSITPFGDNGITLGLAASRWSVVYAGTGTINTSDASEKQQIRSLSDQEKAVAARLKGIIKAFKFNDAVETKGESARIHVGVIAQEVKAAFEDEGLVAERYAVFCYDEWPDEYAPEFKTVVEDVGGNKIETLVATGENKLVRSAGSRYGVRHDQLFAFIISAL